MCEQTKRFQTNFFRTCSPHVADLPWVASVLTLCPSQNCTQPDFESSQTHPNLPHMNKYSGVLKFSQGGMLQNSIKPLLDSTVVFLVSLLPSASHLFSFSLFLFQMPRSQRRVLRSQTIQLWSSTYKPQLAKGEKQSLVVPEHSPRKGTCLSK